MIALATLIVTVAELFNKILPLIKHDYRRQDLANHFRGITSILTCEIEDMYSERKLTKKYINPNGLNDEEIDLALSKDQNGCFDKKIAAIKTYRHRLGAHITGLLEAKNIIEKFQYDNA